MLRILLNTEFVRMYFFNIVLKLLWSGEKSWLELNFLLQNFLRKSYYNFLEAFTMLKLIEPHFDQSKKITFIKPFKLRMTFSALKSSINSIGFLATFSTFISYFQSSGLTFLISNRVLILKVFLKGDDSTSDVGE